MTETPNTAKIRTALMVSGILTVSYSTAMTLCDALDDARGARDYWRNRNIDLKRQEATNAALLAGAYEVSRKALDRGEAAESEALLRTRQMLAASLRTERAEARIAELLDILETLETGQ